MKLSWPAAAGSHTVQFYEGEQYLHRSIASYLKECARRGGPLVLVTKRSTFEAVAAQLAVTEDGPAFDVTRILFVDAEAALADVMSGDTLDRGRFEESIKRLVADARNRDREGTIWVYGEMVDILCSQGNHRAAVQLEELWNELAARKHHVSAVCGYAIHRFDDDMHARHLRAVCAQHPHIIPTEDFSDATDDRMRCEHVALLQHRARVRSRVAVTAPAPTAEPEAPAIYVIDDDASVRRSLGRLLQSVRLPARMFDSAEAFLEQADQLPDACLLVDVQLLGMSGLDLQKKLSENGRQWRIIAMSGAYDSRIEREALRLGAAAFLRKPFVAQTLLETIARLRR